MNPVSTQLSRSSGATARRTIASYASYDETERAVDALSDLRIPHALHGGRRDFASIAGVYADRVELQVDAEVADEARRLLDLTPSTPQIGSEVT